MNEAHTVTETIVCHSCGALNRVPPERTLGDGKCGKCGVSLSTPEPVSVDGAMFERLISRDTGPFVVDIWAPWCGPCRMMAPSYDQAADLMHDEVRFFKLNSDENQEASAKLNLRGIPTLIAYRGGQQKAVQPGAQMGQQLIDWVRHSVGR